MGSPWLIIQGQGEELDVRKWNLCFHPFWANHTYYLILQHKCTLASVFPLTAGENHRKRKILINRQNQPHLTLPISPKLDNRTFRNILYRDLKPPRDGADIQKCSRRVGEFSGCQICNGLLRKAGDTSVNTINFPVDKMQSQNQLWSLKPPLCKCAQVSLGRPNSGLAARWVWSYTAITFAATAPIAP